MKKIVEVSQNRLVEFLNSWKISGECWDVLPAAERSETGLPAESYKVLYIIVITRHQKRKSKHYRLNTVAEHGTKLTNAFHTFQHYIISIFVSNLSCYFFASLHSNY